MQSITLRSVQSFDLFSSRTLLKYFHSLHSITVSCAGVIHGFLPSNKVPVRGGVFTQQRHQSTPVVLIRHSLTLLLLFILGTENNGMICERKRWEGKDRDVNISCELFNKW